MKKITQEKVKIIKGYKHEYRLYVETNHCFIKGFGWFIPQYIPEDKIGVIILKRDTSKIVKSLLRIGCSPLTPFGRRWITTPDKKDPLVQPPMIVISPQITYLLAYFLKSVFRCAKVLFRKILSRELPYPRWLINYEFRCLKWYVDETIAQKEVFKKQFPNIKFYEVNVEDLNSIEQVKNMLDYFGCKVKASMSDVVGEPTNLKRSQSKINR